MLNINNEIKPLKRPEWIKVKAPNSQQYYDTKNLIEGLKLNTVCQEAACPNIGECWSQKHATVMILGSICTRACSFCNVKTGRPDKLDPHEPQRLASAVQKLKLEHVVITSVDRDDLPDGGAQHFAECIREIRKASPHTTIEVLTPDFFGKNNAIEIVVEAKPDVYNHNIEMAASLYKATYKDQANNSRTHMPRSSYYHSLNLLHNVKKLDADIFTKSGMMVGLGEEKYEVIQVMEDLRIAQVDFLTIGQYLQPTKNHAPLMKYYTPEEFEYLQRVAVVKGFSMVSSSPLTRSSYHAGSDFQKLKNNRAANSLNK